MCAVIFPFIRRLFSLFVLISFTLTMLFPSWAWTMEDVQKAHRPTHASNLNSDTLLEEDEHLDKDGRPIDDLLHSLPADDENARTWYRFLKKVIGQDKPTSSFLFSIGIDTSDNLLSDETPNSHQFALPTDFSFSSIQTFFQSQPEIQSYYKGLSLTSSGLTWQAKGYEFILDFAGDLTFYAQNKSVADFAYTESLRVNNPYGDIYIGAEVPSQRLQVLAQNVFYQTPASPLERLDIWAVGVEQTKGIACISAASHLRTREIYQHQGKFFNNGTLHNDINLTLSLKEGGTNTGTITSNGTMTFTTDETFVNNKTIASSLNMVLNGNGELQNLDVISTRGTLSGTLNSLVNGINGTITTAGGFSHFYVKSLVNEGTLSGSGFIRVGKGYNRNILTSGSLHVQVDEEFTHEVGARLKADELLVFEGNGRISHKGMIETPLLEVASKVYEKSSEHHDSDIKRLLLKATNDTFSIDEDATLSLDDFETEENTKSNVSNKGDFTVRKSFTNRRSFVNGGSFSAHTFSHKGAPISNSVGGEISITGDADLETDSAQNDGDWTFEGTLKGIIRQLINKSKGSLRFKKDIHVKGTTAHNQGTLIANKVFNWSGVQFQNDHRLFLYDSQVSASRQFFSTGFARWTHNQFLANHRLNTGYLERTSTFTTTETSVPKFKTLTLTDTIYKYSCFDNFGTRNVTDTKDWRITTKSTPVTRITNNGALHFDKGTLTVAHSIINNGLITAQGALTLESSFVQNTVTIAGKDAISVKADHFDASSGRILSDKALDIKANRLSTNAQTIIRSDETVLLDVRDDYTNFGEIHGTKATTLLGGKMTNRGRVGGEDISFQNTVENYEAIHGTKTTTFLGDKMTNRGNISGEDISFQSTVENYGTIHGTKTARLRGQKATNRGQISSPHLFVYHDIDNAGSIKGKRLDHYNATRITNQKGAEIVVDNYTSDQRLHEILNHGTFVIGSTDKFQVDTLNNHYTFSMQSGKYEISQVNNSDSAEMHWTGGAHLLVGDMVNDGILKAIANFRLIDMHGVRKLGKVFCGNKLIIETTSKTVNPTHFIAHSSPHWQMRQLEIKGEIFNLQHRFVSPVPLTLTVTNFTNQSFLQAPSFFLRSKTFHNGTGQSSFGDIRAEDEIDLTVEESLNNQYGRINVGQIKKDAFTLNATNAAKIKADKSKLKGRLTARSLTGAINNGYYVGSGYYSMNGAFMSAGLSIVLDAKTEVNNYFGELISDDIMYLRAGTQITTTAGRTYSVGGMTWSAPVAVVTRNGGARQQGENVCDPRYWSDMWRQYETSEGANVFSGGDIHFDVNGLTICGSNVTAFGKIYDKNRRERTGSNPGYFSLTSCHYYQHAAKHCGPRDVCHEVHRTLGSTLNSATEISFNFANNLIAGAMIAAANLNMRGDNLTLGYTDASIDSGTNQLGKGGRYSLAETINSLVGGAIRKLSQRENATAVFGTGHSNIPGIAPDRVVTTFTHQMEERLQANQNNPEFMRQLYDRCTMLWALQSTFQRYLNKGYLFPHKGYQEHVDMLTGAAIESSGNSMRLLLKNAEKSDKPLLTCTEELMDGEGVLVPYVTIPEAYIDGDLAYNTGIVTDGREDDDAVDIEMNRSLDQFSSLISGANCVKLHSKGTRRSETLKHAVHFHDRKTSGYKEIARAPAMVKSGGELIDTSISDFRSVGTARKASRNADVRSLEGNMTRLPLQCQSHITSTSGGGGLFGGTERSVTEIRETAFFDDSITSGGNADIGASTLSGHLSQIATKDTARGDIHYYGKTGDLSAHVGIDSISTTAKGTFRNTSSHNEKATVHPLSSMAGGNVIYDFKESVRVSGAIISAEDLIDLTPITIFEPTVGVARQGRSITSNNGLGTSSRSRESGQEVVVPTIIMLSGKFRSIPSIDKRAGSKLVLKAVELSAPGGTEIFKEQLVEESYEAKSWQHETSSKSGFNSAIVDITTAHNPMKAAVDSAIQSTVIGSVRSLEEAEGDFAKGIGAMKVANSAVADGKLAVKAISAPGAAATEFLSRFTSINLGVSSITSQMEHYENLPTHIKTSWFHFDGKIWNHDGGAKLEATRVFVPNAEEITMRSGIHHTVSNAVSDSASVGFNPLAPQASGVNVGNQTTTVTQNIHDHAAIVADYVFIRSKNMLVTGATVRSRVIDVMVEDDLVMESVIDEITKTQEGISIGLSAAMFMGDGALGKIAALGDMAFSDKETKRRWIEQKTSLIATEQLYLTVGKTFVTRSAEARREGSIQAPDYYAVDDRGQSLHLYEREMPNYEDGSAFFALDLHGRGEAEDLLEEQGIELPEGEPTTGILDTLATIQGIDLKIYEQDARDKGKLVLVHAFKGGDEPINLVHVAADPRRPGALNHFNRLEETEGFARAGNRVEEHMPEEYGAVVTEEGYDISLPFATIATFAGNVVDGVKWVESATQIRAHDESAKAKAIIATEALESGISEQETATIQQEVDSVYDDVAEANAIINSLKEKQEHEQAPGKKYTQTKGNAKAIDEPLLFAGARSPSGQTPISRTSMSSKAATDKPIYGQTKTGFDQATSVPLTFDQPRQLANQQGEAALVYALNKLSRATTKLESLGEQYPGIRSGLGFAAQVIEIGARTAYYVKMTASGSAAGIAVCGPLAANPYGAAVCSIGGGVAGLTAAFGTEQVIASGLEKGIEETSKAAGRQGRTAEESAKFEQSVQNTAFYLGALGSIFGAKKVAGNAKAGAKGKTVQFADEVIGENILKPTNREKLFGTNHVATIDGQRVRPGENGQRPQNYKSAGKYFEFDQKYLDKKLEKVTNPERRADITKDVMKLRQKYPQGVYYSGTGHPDLSRHATRKVQIDMQGNHTTDFTQADALAIPLSGSDKFSRPSTDTWHHHQDKTSMLLVDKKLHKAVPHTGGVSEVTGGSK